VPDFWTIINKRHGDGGLATGNEEETMKFFTPQLIQRFGSSDPEIAVQADPQWDEAADRYDAYLKEVRPQLPEGLRHLLDNYDLHDGVVFGMGQQQNHFIIVLQLDTPPQDFLILTYDLIAEPEIQRDVLPSKYRCAARVEWMYDEVEPDADRRSAQSVLFSNGWEVRLRFRDVHVQLMHPVLPLCAPLPLAVAAASRTFR
jgi:hypothetical protein